MYLRAVHAETYIPVLRQFIRDNPLGIITTAIPSKTQPFIQSSHIPWILDVQDDSSETELGKLRGHMARANPQSKTMIESILKTQTASANSDFEADSLAHDNGHFLEEEVLILFNGPAHSYVTPKFYVETKPSTGKVVPTWNYSAVQVYGRARIYYDPKSPVTGSYLQKQISELSLLSETRIMNHDGNVDPTQPKPWGVEEAPVNYINLLKKAIIGVEIEIDRMEGKFKMSQEMDVGDREGVVDGFAGLGTDVGDKISHMVKERGARRDAQKNHAPS
jgi:transcriptional regulator